MTEWQKTRLGNVIELKRGYDLPSAQRRAGVVPIVSSSGPSGFHNETKVKAPGVVTGRYGTVGQVFYIDRDFWPLNTSLYVRDFKGNHPRFVYYFMKTLDWIGYNDKSGVPGINRNDVHRAEIIFPCLDIQKRVAALLGALDDKIELNRRVNETIEAMAQAIFKDWFVDFGPTRAKMDGRAPYLAPDIWALFPNRINDTTGLPEGWDMRTLNSFFEIIGGGTPKTSEARYWNGDIPWFSVVDTPMKGSIFVIETDKNITNKGLAESSARLIPAGTTIISARGTVGNLAIAGVDLTFNQSCYALRHTEKTGDCFVYLAAQHMVAQLQGMAHGSVFSTITRQTFEAVSLAMPASSVLAAFEEQVICLFKHIRMNVFETRTMTQVRDLLLPKLMSGEISLRDAENVAGEAQ